ncbi:MFS transporter [Amycolatopsis orientalis]|uniref:MFS transporter n=1 Tax=Amycolatopsis orientalis TaxID=31958 RepID=UPI00039FAAC0|nr:MFS transporter [Amycolatopsis orientalis]
MSAQESRLAQRSGPDARVRPGVLWSFTALTFLAVLLDGFDTVSLAFSLPEMAAGWHVSPADFSLALVLTNLGAVAGYVLSGWLSTVLGPKRFLLLGVAWYGLFTLMVAATLPMHSIPLLAGLRFVTGLGLGAVLPVAIALGSAHAPARLRERVAVLTTLGLAVGATVGGFVGGSLISSLGARGVFWVAGALPFVVAGALMLHPMPNALPADAVADAAVRRREAAVSQLFTPRLRVFTAVLWVFAFVAFLTTYIINSWVPSLLKDYGFTAVQAPLGIAMYNLGGILGTLVLVLLSTRLGTARTQVVTSCFGIAALAVLGVAQLTHAGVLVALLIAGAGTITNGNGQMAVATTLYPTGARATGIGWNAAVGRVGSIVAPAVGGVLIAASFGARPILLIAAVPVVVALACAAFLGFRRPAPADR